MFNPFTWTFNMHTILPTMLKVTVFSVIGFHSAWDIFVIIRHSGGQGVSTLEIVTDKLCFHVQRLDICDQWKTVSSTPQDLIHSNALIRIIKS